MKVILVGHPESQQIVKASKYLTDKYLPDFDVVYLNYKGELSGWSAYVADYLQGLTDELVIFALDDYLLSSPIDMELFKKAQETLGDDVKCVKLCVNTPEEHEGYPVTTQYTLWDRRFLVTILSMTKDPWHFEITGSSILRGLRTKSSLLPCLFYSVHSCLSKRWEGIRLDGVKEEDIKELKRLKYL